MPSLSLWRSAGGRTWLHNDEPLNLDFENREEGSSYSLEQKLYASVKKGVKVIIHPETWTIQMYKLKQWNAGDSSWNVGGICCKYVLLVEVVELFRFKTTLQNPKQTWEASLLIPMQIVIHMFKGDSTATKQNPHPKNPPDCLFIQLSTFRFQDWSWNYNNLRITNIIILTCMCYFIFSYQGLKYNWLQSI